MSGVRPELSARVTSPLLLISICRASQWSLYAAAWTDVLHKSSQDAHSVVSKQHCYCTLQLIMCTRPVSEHSLTHNRIWGKLLLIIIVKCRQVGTAGKVSPILNKSIKSISTTRVDVPSWRVTDVPSTRLVETTRPSTRPVLTGNGNRSPVNSGSGNWALGPEHIPVSRQSVCRWWHIHKWMIGCHYFQPGLRLPS